MYSNSTTITSNLLQVCDVDVECLNFYYILHVTAIAFVFSLLNVCAFSSFFKIKFSVNMIKAEHFDLSPRLLIFYYKL